MARLRQDPLDCGFSLIELLIAVLVLALLASGVASLTVLAGRTLIHTRAETVAAWLADNRLEQLRSLSWGLGSAHAPVAGIDLSTDLSARDPVSGGTGLADAPAGALDADTAGFVDYLDQAGRWLAAGSTPPAGTRFVRRWSVTHLAADPGLVLLRVRVVDRRGELADVVLATVRARTAG